MAHHPPICWLLNKFSYSAAGAVALWRRPTQPDRTGHVAACTLRASARGVHGRLGTRRRCLWLEAFSIYHRVRRRDRVRLPAHPPLARQRKGWTTRQPLVSNHSFESLERLHLQNAGASSQAPRGGIRCCASSQRNKDHKAGMRGFQSPRSMDIINNSTHGS